MSHHTVSGFKYLLLDDRVIDHTENARLSLGTVAKHPVNPLFGEEYPWERDTDNLYPNTLYDEEEKLYKCWYLTWMNVWFEGAHPSALATCYATSEDGFRWTKPLLDIYPYQGQPTNLVALHNHGVGVLKDLHDPDPGRRYKLFGRRPEARLVVVAFSADGIHWGDLIDCPEVEAYADTHNNALWVPELGRYVGFTRLWDGQRLVGRTESTDFVHWTKAVEVLRGTKERQTYGMCVFPYANVYLGLMPILAAGTDRRVHCELAWSPDTTQWHRVDEGAALIPNSETEGDYDHGMVYPALNPIVRGKEIRLYYGGCPVPHVGKRSSTLNLATLGLDRFAGYAPERSDRHATVLTQPIRCAGSALRLTADAAGGSVKVTLLSAAGAVLATAEPVVENVTDKALSFLGGNDLSALGDSTVRLRVEIDRAKVYAFSFSGG